MNLSQGELILGILGLGFCGMTVLGLGRMVLSFARIRTGAPSRQFEADMAARLDRLEQAIDAVAVEVERVSESQRFLTKNLADRGVPLVSTPSRSSD